VNQITMSHPTPNAAYMTIPAAADRFQMSMGCVRHKLKSRRLIALSRQSSNSFGMPKDFKVFWTRMQIEKNRRSKTPTSPES
ncbi:MAG: hypothetical protein ACI9P7_000503, partial [Candidatus Azotimanducaceae bacterium]